MRRALAAIAALLCSLAPPAPGQEGPVRPEHLYLSPGLLIGSTRLIALGGAYVGIAEGTAGFTSNLSSLAHRKPTLDDDWSVDVALSYLDLPLGNPAARDLDNDGRPDDARVVRQLVSGMLIQYRNVGVGGYNRTTFLRYCLQSPCVEGDVQVTLANSALAAALALGEDELIVALGLYATTGEVVFGTDRWSYGGAELTFDGLYRPLGRNFRVGFSVKPRVLGRLEAGAPAFLGRGPMAALVSPLTVSLGGSLRLGAGAERYNTLPAIRRRELGLPVEVASGDGPPRTPAGRWLLAAQVDLLSPVDGAVAVRSFLEPAGAPLAAVGAFTQVAPRLGVEHETVPGRLRLRAGGYLEPAPAPDRFARLHATGGVELFLGRYLEDWAVSLSFDVAERYSDLGISVGFWR